MDYALALPPPAFSDPSGLTVSGSLVGDFLYRLPQDPPEDDWLVGSLQGDPAFGAFFVRVDASETATEGLRLLTLLRTLLEARYAEAGVTSAGWTSVQAWVREFLAKTCARVADTDKVLRFCEQGHQLTAEELEQLKKIADRYKLPQDSVCGRLRAFLGLKEGQQWAPPPWPADAEILREFRPAVEKDPRTREKFILLLLFLYWRRMFLKRDVHLLPPEWTQPKKRKTPGIQVEALALRSSPPPLPPPPEEEEEEEEKEEEELPLEETREFTPPKPSPPRESPTPSPTPRVRRKRRVIEESPTETEATEELLAELGFAPEEAVFLEEAQREEEELREIEEEAKKELATPYVPPRIEPVLKRPRPPGPSPLELQLFEIHIRAVEAEVSHAIDYGSAYRELFLEAHKGPVDLVRAMALKSLALHAYSEALRALDAVTKDPRYPSGPGIHPVVRLLRQRLVATFYVHFPNEVLGFK